MIEEKIILEESEEKYEHRLNNVFGNNKPIAINTKYTVLNSGSPGEIIFYKNNEENFKHIKLEDNDILYLEFSPFNDDILAILNINNIISIIDLSEFKVEKNQIKTVCKLSHEGKVDLMNFNPIKQNIICSCEKGGLIHIWDINSGKAINRFNTDNEPVGISWSPNGNLIGICFRNGILKIYNTIDNRFYEVFSEKISEKETLVNCFSWIYDNSFVSVGWGEDNCKNIFIWDNFQSNENSILGDCQVYSTKINDDNSDIVPFTNQENNLIYLVNNRQENSHSVIPSITVYEFKEEKIHKKTEYFSTHQDSISILLNKNFYQKNQNEIDRFIRYSSEDNKIYFVSIYKEVENENLNINQNEELKAEIERQKLINENILRENKELKNKLNEIIRENEEYQRFNSILRKDFEDIKIEKENQIKEHRIEINNLENNKKNLEEEIEKLKEELDKEKYEKYKKELILENKNNLEKEILDFEKQSLIKNVSEQPSFNNLTIFKDFKGILLKLKSNPKNMDNNMNDVKISVNNKENNGDCKIYNVNIIDRNKEVALVFGNECQFFNFEKNIDDSQTA